MSARSERGRDSLTEGEKREGVTPSTTSTKDVSSDSRAFLFVAGVNAALTVFRLFPPPATGALVLAFANRARARRAAHRRIALGVQRVHRHGVLAHIVPHVVLGPRR